MIRLAVTQSSFTSCRLSGTASGSTVNRPQMVLGSGGFSAVGDGTCFVVIVNSSGCRRQVPGGVGACLRAGDAWPR